MVKLRLQTINNLMHIFGYSTRIFVYAANFYDRRTGTALFTPEGYYGI
jgi:hypothetical protein